VTRDRDDRGRPRNARPRDSLGRPLPYESNAPDGSPAPAAEAIDPDLSRLESAAFPELLAGAQGLLDQGRPFEAHELLEAAWKRAPEAERPLWRALAQLAVGITHALRGNQVGAQAVLTRSAAELERWVADPPYGIAARELAEAARRMAAGAAPEPVRLRSTREPV
jgi:hypothetical protein